MENDGLLQADTSAIGNSLLTGSQGVNATLHGVQSANANINSVVTVTGVNTGDGHLSLGTPVYVTTQGMGNYTGVVASAGSQSANTITQTANGTHIYADSTVDAPNNAIYQSGEIDATALANQVQFGATDARITGSVDQTSNTYNRARSGGIVYYSPSDVLYSATATSNYVSSNGTGASSVDLSTHQVANTTTEAYAQVNGGNTWSVAGTANAAGNVVDLGNAGGSLVAVNDQTNNGYVLSQSNVNTYEFGTATAQAIGVGNSFYGGNNDIYTDVDNSQLNTGAHGVEVTANFSANNGWDAYVTADASGNTATAFSCATCGGVLNVGNEQDNETGVSATTHVNVAAQSRSIVSTAHAVGNSGVFYTSSSQPGH